MGDKNRAAIAAAVITLGVLWGLNWPAVKVMLGEISPFTIRAVALSVAAILLGVIALAQSVPLRPSRAEAPALVLAGLLTVFGFNVLVTFGQLLTETASATILAYTMPVMTAVLAGVLLKERLERRHQLAILLAGVGIICLAAKDAAGLLSQPVGPLIVLLSALSWSLGNVVAKGRTWSLPSISMTVWFLGVSAIACWPLVLIFEPLSAQQIPSAHVAAVMAFHILGPMITCYYVYARLVADLPASIAALATLLAPVVGVSSAIVLLGDPLTWQKIAALALIVSSIALTFFRFGRR